jgi:hypothetical protein
MIAPFAVGQFGSSWVRILDFCLLYIMLALGLNIVSRLCRFIRFRLYRLLCGRRVCDGIISLTPFKHPLFGMD